MTTLPDETHTAMSTVSGPFSLFVDGVIKYGNYTIKDIKNQGFVSQLTEILKNRKMKPIENYYNTPVTIYQLPDKYIYMITEYNITIVLSDR